MIGYLPTNKSRQSSTLKVKRQEYLDGIKVIEQSLNFDEDSSKSTSSSTINMNREKAIVSSNQYRCEENQSYCQII